MVQFLDYSGLEKLVGKIKGRYINMMANNEFNFIGKEGWSDGSDILINYRKPDGNTTTTPITTYTFYNGQKSAAGVNVVAENFKGKINGVTVPSTAKFTDENVRYAEETSGVNYPLVFSPQGITEDSKVIQGWPVSGARYNKSIYVNPKSGNITATTFTGNLSGKATSAGNADTVNSHTVDANVPSTAVFTDSKVTQKLVKPTEVTSFEMPILFGNSAGASKTITDVALVTEDITANLSLGTITAKKFVGKADSADTADSANSLNLQSLITGDSLLVGKFSPGATDVPNSVSEFAPCSVIGKDGDYFDMKVSNANNALTVGGHTVEVSVPNNAKFTDKNVLQEPFSGTNNEKYPLLIGSGVYNPSVSQTLNETTGKSYITNNIYAIPGKGTIYANDYIGKIKGVDVPDAPKFTDSHYTTGIKAGSQNSNINEETENGSTYINVTDDDSFSGGILIKGTGGTTVTSDANGNITINSTSSSSYSVATESSDGLMSKDDKKKVNKCVYTDTDTNYAYLKATNSEIYLLKAKKKKDYDVSIEDKSDTGIYLYNGSYGEAKNPCGANFSLKGVNFDTAEDQDALVGAHFNFVSPIPEGTIDTYINETIKLS